MSAAKPNPAEEVPVDARIAEIVRRALGEAEICAVLALPAESLNSDGAAKPDGYRASVRVDVQSGGLMRGLVLHTAMSNHFGHDPADVPGAPSARLAAIERRCWDWRWRLKNRGRRLTRTHGDFHPFNVLFSKESELVLLDASRGCVGDPADDVSCMAINYVFFALGRPGAWDGAFRSLWLGFWQSYTSRRSDSELLAVCAPFLAWRALVLCNPVWYPELMERDRDRLLSFVERTLDAERLDPTSADAVFA